MRVNINVGLELNKWFEAEASRIGITKSGLMAMALNDYMYQRTAIGVMGDSLSAYNELKGVGSTSVSEGLQTCFGASDTVENHNLK